jgi:MSHA pilin protein MshC
MIKLNKNRGFTLVELITVMIIVGIISAVAMPKFFSRSDYDGREFYDQVKATLRHAQKIAIAQRRFVCVVAASRTVTVTYGATSTCGSQLTSPEGKNPYTVTSPTSDVTLSSATFSFDALGRPSAAQSVTVSGYASSITVEAETGYVH